MSEPITGFESDINSDISVEDKLVVFATKTESIELPGSLASSGPRHDNDHEDISKIQILPTMSEIQAIRPEYLPRKNTRSFHENHLQGYLDAQFRLLRRNCIGPLIDTIRQSWLQQLALCDEIPNSKKGMELYRAFGYSEAYQPPNTHCYFNLEVLNVEFHEGRGQIADVRFEQPPTIQNLVAGQRARWWAESGRLGTGALMCMLDVDGHQLFCAPLDEPSFPLDNERDVYCMMTRTVGKGVNATVPKDLFSDRKWAYTRLRITTCSNEMHTNLVRFFTNSPAKQCLVEQPGTLVPSFKPSLDVLQEYSQTRNMPFADLLCCSGQTGLITMAPPAYSNDEFRFNLRSIMKDGRSAFLTPHKHFEMDVLREGSSLDEGQAKALVNALTSRIALIQGPPGTGKSFTGEAIARVLLDNREKAQLGPLVIMAQTNHALDEVLERMKPFCPEGVIRIGTGSKSSSQWLSHYNLKKQAWRKGSPRDQHQTSKLRAERTVAAKECENLLSNIRNASNDKWAMANEVQELLASICPNRHTQIFGQRHGELQDARTALQNWIDSGCETNFTPRPLISLQEADMIIATFSREERISISDYWFDQQLELTKREYETAAAKWQQATDKIAEIRQGQDLLCLQDAKVIGVTSAGMTSRKKTFDLLKSKVMICEEAGEILEANTIAALYQSLEHVIMIGDHQQLRPHVGWDMSVYNSKGRAFSLDISLFERLVGHSDNDGTTMRLPVTTLSTQRRMHPSISRFTRLQYENLEDGENVHEYPQVAGMKDRLYWIDHTEYEDNVGRLAAEVNPSASNQYEVDYICALVEYLVRQGRYETKDIAVIVPYGSQERKIRDKLSKVKSVRQKAAIDDQDDWFGDEKTEKATFMAPTSLCVRISTIDNFQGEQADVIIASLTRSNPNQSMGFLSFDARINVLLSRAKHGMYIFGSRSNFSSGSGIWPKVIGTLERDGLIGTELKLECPRHPENKIIIRGPQDFLTKAPQGGCDVRCGKPLACGHECHAPCHSDLMHSHHECQDRCQRKFDCGHQCRKLCFEECDEVCPMMDTELGRKLACGHDGTSVPC
ncbi:P-loop containing nucleoside triphosphate hydrolase protein, partial [Saccharata proteae CBS 121410]